MSGITTYDVNKPTYAYTDQTTEFDDECIRRGIITKADAIVRKGATPAEAHRLVAQAAAATEADDVGDKMQHLNLADKDEMDSDSGDDFLRDHRSKRLSELKAERSTALNSKSKGKFGSVLTISRPDWPKEVNEASMDGQWVIIHLTCDSVWESRIVEEAMRKLAAKFADIKFVSIRSTSAIKRWPDSNLPTIFLYQNGSMQQQFIGLESLGGYGVNEDRIEYRLAKAGVLETEFQTDPERSSNFDKKNPVNRVSHGMAELATYDEDNDEDDLNDYDNVD
mmetsp:Transcript_7127/g.10649  ORF Transcript_7127/g.10649 Transcript_7127/m.10649 type:complete len:280 (-) Transcript_7127:150-989(-)|eukprot:CAMPEP_0116011868 /NCGR_PEP_ID=MMETSP0321-20121206/4807_1 /TAXON_ID=163516 /ORGANISM="Leptocylindrus danicus var. danicus, Strain B650" /LENGTH=279 /DNA_ID=CAMNT_0003481149 /DNA_START=37 /DNA_END=876 /DNA_ORIENTATION=-